MRDIRSRTIPAHPITIPELSHSLPGPAAAPDAGEGLWPLRIAAQFLAWTVLLKGGLLAGGALAAAVQYLVELG